MNKIEEAQNILKALGVPIAQQNEMSALTLLALCNIKEVDSWRKATQQSLGVSKGIMSFVAENYGRHYAPNTRETFRRQVLHQFVQGRIADYNPDEPDLPVNSPKAHYAISEKALSAIRTYKTNKWKSAIKSFITQVGALSQVYEKERSMVLIPVTIDGNEIKLSSGQHNEVQVAVIEQFAPRFAGGAKVLYLGDTAKKDLHIDKNGLKNIGFSITEHSKLPDVVIYDDEREWLFLIEVVTSHGPVSPKRMLELEDFLRNSKVGRIYITVFPDKSEFKKHIADIAWETEVWIADNPDHMIHFNGDKFIGPRHI
jgi:hypothetical protein